MSDKTTYPIPRGWRRVTRGVVRRGDKGWDRRLMRFTEQRPYEIGLHVSIFTCVIRRAKGGAS